MCASFAAPTVEQHLLSTYNPTGSRMTPPGLPQFNLSCPDVDGFCSRGASKPRERFLAPSSIDADAEPELDERAKRLKILPEVGVVVGGRISRNNYDPPPQPSPTRTRVYPSSAFKSGRSRINPISAGGREQTEFVARTDPISPGRALVDVRFAPKATRLLRSSEMTRWGTTGCEQTQRTIRTVDARSSWMSGRR